MAKSAVSGYGMFGAAGADLSQATSTSAVTIVKRQDNVGILVDWTGSSPSGTLTIQVADDYNSDVPTSGTWHTLNFGSTITISGSPGQHEITINQLPYTALRAQYTKVSGTGTLFATLSAKSLSGGAN